MNFLIAPDSFKGGLKNTTFCNILEEILEKSGFTAVSIPMTDGGDGFTETVMAILGGKILEGRATDPNFFLRPVIYGVKDDTAVISTADCCGLSKTMIKDPLFTTSYGLGECIKLVKALGKKKIIIGLGGSATNDGGVGAVCALGGKFYNENGEELIPCGGSLKDIKSYDLTAFYKNIEGLDITALTDVENPLLGKDGCSRIFAPQKGARDADIEVLEANMQALVTLTKDLNVDPNGKYMGAAGGIGYGMRAFFKAKILSGAKYTAEISGLENAIKNADCVITGEGKFDISERGKVSQVVISLAKKHGKKAVVFCGEGEETEEADVVTINDKGMTLRENVANSESLLRYAAVKYFGEHKII